MAQVEWFQVIFRHEALVRPKLEPGTFKNEAKRMRNAPNMAMLERILDDFR